MHMADALLSPLVGAACWVVSGVALARASRRLQSDPREDLVPLMGVLAAFVFAAQMINFTIPGTGSSGHIGGGLLLSILLGPQAAFVAIASVLTVQALFFADGGLLALGANLLNIGVCTCFVAYPMIYRPLMRHAGDKPSRRRVAWITTLATVLGLQLGALSLVAQTQLSGISSLPLSSFLLLMQPIHLAIGLVEGLATAALIVFVRDARPDLLAQDVQPAPARAQARVPARWLVGFAALALVGGGVVSSFASSAPDGLEWSIARVTGQSGLADGGSRTHALLASLQAKTALLPDYTLPGAQGQNDAKAIPSSLQGVDTGTSVAGVVGGAITFALVLAVGLVVRRRQRLALHEQR